MRGFLLLLILLALPVHGDLVVNKYTNDFALTSIAPDTVRACSCEDRSDQFAVTNSGNFYTTYNVEVNSPQDWWQASVAQFTLAPGDTFGFLVHGSPGCAKPGLYPYEVKVISNYGRERSIGKTLDVLTCQNVLLSASLQQESVVVGQPIRFDVTIQNVAGFEDTFLLDFPGREGSVSVPERLHRLKPDEERTVSVVFTLPPDVTGETLFRFGASSERNGIREQIALSAEIENPYDHEVALETQAEVCSRVPALREFTVRNLYELPNTYRIAISGPDFISSSTEVLTLDGHESEKISLGFLPEHGQEGRYQVSVTATSEMGGVERSRSIEVDVFDCYSFDAGAPDLQFNGTVYEDASCCGEKEYLLNIRNEGHAEETYNILIDGPSWFAPEERSITLKVAENRNVAIRASLPCSDETYEIPVHVALASHPELVQTVIYSIRSEHPLTCHAVEMDVSTLRLSERDRLVPVIVRSVGIEGGSFTAHFDSRLFDGIQEQKVSLTPGGEAVLHLQTKPNLTDFQDGRYLGHLTLENEEGLEYRQAVWVRYRHSSWVADLWAQLRAYDYSAVPYCLWLMLGLAIVTVVILFWLLLTLIGWRFDFQKGITEDALFTLRLVAFLLFIIALATLIFSPLPDNALLHEEPLQDSSGLVIQWYENGQHTLQLGEYFSDPDGDWLEYVATQPAHISISIDGDRVLLTPERNWAGEEKVVFTARDQEGGIVDSPILLLKVLKRQELNFVQWLIRYCIQINLGLLVLALFMFLLVTLVGITPVVFYPLEPPIRPPEVLFIGARTGSKVHLKGCTVAERIPRTERIIFRSSEEALAEGYGPCKVCRPFR